MLTKDLTILITGTNGAGKDTVALFFKKRGFNIYSHSDELKKILKGRGLEITRDNLFNLGNELRREKGNGILSEITLDKLKLPAVILGIRHLEELSVYRKNLDNLFLLAVDAPSRVRHERSKKRTEKKDEKNFSYEEFVERDEREMKGEEEVQQIGKVMEMADVTVMNSSTIDDLYKKLEDVYSNLEKEK